MFIRIHSWLKLVVALPLVFCPPALAHQGSSSYLSITANGPTVTGQWDISLIDLEQVVGLDADGDSDITLGEVKAKQAEIESYARSRLRLVCDGTERSWRLTELSMESFSDGAYAVLRFALESPGSQSGAHPSVSPNERGGSRAAGEIPKPNPNTPTTPPRNLEIDYRAFFDVDSLHRGLLRLQGFGNEQTAVFSPDHPTFVLRAPSGWRQFLAFNREGVWHIWRGFDHILFLLALLLPSVLRREAGSWRVVDRFRPALICVLKIVTAFTVAHSITLSLATVGVVRLPSRLVEPVIAASVIVAAFNNIRPLLAERGWIVAFCFGLVHGFGFANGLADLGLTRQTLGLALVGFNLGVEIGQLAIVAAFLPLAFALRASWVYQRLTFRFGSAVIAMLAATWMMERILNLKWLPF